MDAAMESRLVVDALEMALARRLPLQGSSPSGLVAHSDRGSQYASEHYQRRLAEERHGSGIGRWLRLYRLYYSLYFSTCRVDDPPTYAWCVRNLKAWRDE